ncbi:MAG: IS66 family insertion sequence element accessory protein TnpA [Bryobacteraceae bacterium]
MAETVGDEKAIAKNDQWRERIAAQERSGLSVRRFCKEQGIAEHLLFYWRKRLRNQQQSVPVRFALVERGVAPVGTVTEPALELVLNTGERLRIGVGVDQTALRTVLAALRA